MRVAVIGSRDYTRSDLVRAYVARQPRGTVIVTGAWDAGRGQHAKPTRGVDWAAYSAAIEAGLIPILVVANPVATGRGAGLQRNPEAVAIAERVAAFWNGVSTGTIDTVRLAVAAELPIDLFGPAGEKMDVLEAIGML